MLLVQAWDNQGAAPAGWASHIFVYWRDFEPSAGQYRYDLFERALRNADRPCYLQLGFSVYDKVARAPVDASSPAHKRSIALTAASGVTGEVPDYSPAWAAAYSAAVKALAEHFRTNPQVAGYWHAAGWNQETQAAVNNSGGLWGDMLRERLEGNTYYRFIRDTTAAAVAAWAPVPVYLPGAPSPGVLWGGSAQRDVVLGALRAGAGYMNCGLQIDMGSAVGLHEHAGQKMFDSALQAPYHGFEEGPRAAKGEAGEVYWFLLHALHWGGQFVNLYSSISASQALEVAGRLPRDGDRWIVFRDAEYAPQVWTGKDGRQYGQSAVPGCWGRGLTWLGSGTLALDRRRYDAGRWVLDTGDEPLHLAAPGLPDGCYPVRVYWADGSIEAAEAAVAGERLTLPPGRYHRVDLHEPALEPETLETVLRLAAEAHDRLAIYPDAALCKAGAARGLWPTSDEFRLSHGGVTYVAQRFRDPLSDRVVVLYAAMGDWANVQAVEYGGGTDG